MNQETFPIRKVIFQEGEAGTYLCAILNGSVEIYKNYGESNEKMLTELNSGSYFGEMGLIDGLPRSATAVALPGSELLFVTETDFPSYLKENPETAVKIMKTMSGRLRDLTGDFMEACSLIAEALETEEKKKSKTLLGRLKKFADIYWESCQEITAARVGLSMADQVAFYSGYRCWY